MKDLLLTQPVRSCFIVVEATKMREELQKKSHTNPYRDLLKTASGCTVGKNVSPVSRPSVSLVPSGGVLGKVSFLSMTPRAPRFTSTQFSLATRLL